MKLYTLTKNVNYADTSRDPDDIHTDKLGVFDSINKAKQVALNYRDEHFFKKDADFFVGGKNLLCLMDFCSYPVWLNIEEDELTAAPQVTVGFEGESCEY